ncbi:hypothetical protein [Flammeovirga kamogawensis]|uniref:Lipoprotein n=1 Tax=Flammeovirga kamogawensis TaxID=373891 RepID=A0ABX8H2A3_9BACT|nr:hypothetical protein [Flammeovirga kamogawensis]MBB6463573.1 hypothetical protein [Flammeovirga kamogawensis]QWG09799.1 hypothetical protein KM029_19150 [Flammeovirga kamogawensis]TRX65307.1 hypothetical protein EO216_22555 [Flammeovirga kamogawensis]
MFNSKIIFLFLLSLVCIYSCKTIEKKSEVPNSGFYLAIHEEAISPDLEKITGIIPSQNKDYLWVQENKGNNPFIYLYNTKTGKQEKKVFIRGTSIAWEDLAKSYNDKDQMSIHVADIGDPHLSRKDIQVYSFKENDIEDDFVAPEVKYFTYPNGPRNASAMIVNQTTEEYYIFTLSKEFTEVYAISIHERAGQLKQIGVLPFGNVTNVDISFDNSRLLIVKEGDLSMWNLENKDKLISNLLNKKPDYIHVKEASEYLGSCFKDEGKFYVLDRKKPDQKPVITTYEGGGVTSL